jgi:hypothetical protein
MPSLKHPKGSGQAAKHDPKLVGSARLIRGRDIAAAHAKRPSGAASAHLTSTRRGSGARAKHVAVDVSEI